MKKTLIALCVLALASPVAAEDKPGDWVISLSAGAGVPFKSAGKFDANAKVAGYVKAALEHSLSDRFSVYGRMDLSSFTTDVGPSYKATTLGGGGIIKFDLVPENNFTGGIKIGAAKSNTAAHLPAPTWEMEIGPYIEGNFNGNARIRGELLFLTYSEQINGLFASIGLAFDPKEVWK